jgi:hypothetical protein
MDRRISRRRDWEEEDRPRKPKRKSKKKSGALLVVFVVLGAITIAGLCGVGVFLYLRTGTKQTEETGDRFIGKWEGTSPERPSVKVYLEVTRDRVILQGQNIRTNEWGEKQVYSWASARVSGNTMIINRREVYGEQREAQWSVQFVSDDEMSVTPLSDNRLIANFKRIGKMVTQRDRDEAAARNSAKIIGKWSVLTFQSIKLHRGTLEFAEGGKAVFTIKRDKIGERTDTGTWKVLEAEGNKLKLEISGIEDFELLNIELRSDEEMALSQASKAGSTGVQLTATRVR